MANHVRDMTDMDKLKLILEALEQSTPKAIHYDEPRQRHAQAIEATQHLIAELVSHKYDLRGNK
jgi:hypothetical protein